MLSRALWRLSRNTEPICPHCFPNCHQQVHTDLNFCSIGGDNVHIIKTLASHLKYRSDEKWHIVGIPESHLQSLVPKANHPHVGVAGQGGPARAPAVQAPQQGAQGVFGPGDLAAQRALIDKLKADVIRMGQESDCDEDDGATEQNAIAFSGQQSQPYQQGQQPGYPPQHVGNLGQIGNGGSAQGYAQAQQTVGYPPQGNFGGFGQDGAQVPPLPQVHQGSLGSFGPGPAQAQQSGLSQQGSVGGSGQGGADRPIPMDYMEFMTTQRQGAAPYDALAPGAEVLYVPGQDDWIFGEQGIALGQPDNGSNSNNNNNTNAGPAAPAAPQHEIRLTPLLQPAAAITEEPDSMTKALRAHINSPGRFEDKSGTGRCDWCGRHGHEAVSCLRWDPEHFDKAACVVCNNASHGVDECPRFARMAREARASLLLGGGAWRPGVRSRHHAWTDYCTREYRGQGFPMTRRFARGLAGDARTGPVVRNLWKVWDYRRGVPREFRDPAFDSVRKIVLAGLDEKFQTDRPFSMYGDKGSSTPGVGGGENEDENEDEGDGEGDE